MRPVESIGPTIETTRLYGPAVCEVHTNTMDWYDNMVTRFHRSVVNEFNYALLSAVPLLLPPIFSASFIRAVKAP